MRTVTVFGSSLPGQDSPAYAEARRLGRLLAEAGFAICNGGYSGLMEASARGGREAGCHTVGVTCELWPRTANPWILEEVCTSSFPERIMTLIRRGDAYIVLPGGTGTLAELALAWEMMNKSVLADTLGGRKPLLVMVPYWQPVIDCLDQEMQLAVSGSDWHPPGLECVIPVRTVDDAALRLKHWLERMTCHPAPAAMPNSGQPGLG